MLTPQKLFELTTLAQKAKPELFGELFIENDVWRIPAVYGSFEWNPEANDYHFLSLLCFLREVCVWIINSNSKLYAINGLIALDAFIEALSQDNRKEIYCQKVIEMLKARLMKNINQVSGALIAFNDNRIDSPEFQQQHMLNIFKAVNTIPIALALEKLAAAAIEYNKNWRVDNPLYYGKLTVAIQELQSLLEDK